MPPCGPGWSFPPPERASAASRIGPFFHGLFWASQTVLADALQKANVPVTVLTGEGSGPDAHGLKNSARTVAGWCARNMGTEEMVERAAKGLKG